MNERIRQLAEQAGFMDSWFSESGDDCEQELKKFAELIVKECGVALSPMLRDMVSRGQAYNLIKEHFGVKE
jgi:hypothetical protein